MRAAHDAVREALSAPLVGAARADYILDALRRLPVEQRMEAMGMRKRLLADVWANDNRMMPLWTE